ncbi:MAG TPA: hypothetical protein VF290_22615 [Pyrinomonadaceae bacterium]
MKNRITRSAVLLLTVVSLVTLVSLSRHQLQGTALAQSQEKPKKWEYCYVSSPFLYGSSGGVVSTKVFVSQGGEKWLADSDSTGVSALNRLGADGWELVSASDELMNTGGAPSLPTTTRFLLKRQK